MLRITGLLVLATAVTFAALPRDAGAAASSMSLVVNGDFDADASMWSVPSPADTDATYEPSIDREGDPSSGSLRIANTPAGAESASVSQCVRVAPGIPMTITASVNMPPASQPAGAEAQLQTLYFTNETCTGAHAGGHYQGSAPAPGWRSIVVDVTVPAGIFSMFVTLEVTKQLGEPALAYAYVDGITATSNSAADIIINGDINTDLDGWTVNSTLAEYDENVDRFSVVASGAAFLREMSEVPDAGGLEQCLRAAPGIPLTVSAFTLFPTSFQAPDAFVQLKVESHADGACSAPAAFEEQTILPAPGWQQMRIDTTTPPGTMSIKVYLVLGKGEASVSPARAWFDGVSVIAAGDGDGDGCENGEELRANPLLGGDRNPIDSWDFFDVPTPALVAGDTTGRYNRQVNLSDVLSIITFAGTSQGGPPNPAGADYDTDYNANGVVDGAEYDRTPSQDPAKPWRSGPPDGAVTLADVIVALQQAGHNCAG